MMVAAFNDLLVNERMGVRSFSIYSDK